MSGALGGQLLRYCIVGAIGFVVDAGVLWILLETTGLGPYGARVLSFLTAATTTWALHRHITFPAAARDRRGRQWAAFVAVNGGGAALNYGVYALLVATTAVFAAHPVLAVAVGSAVALAANFLANRHWVFRDART